MSDAGELQRLVRETRDRLADTSIASDVAEILKLHGVRGYDPAFPHDSMIDGLNKAGADALRAINMDLDQRGVASSAGITGHRVLLFASHVAEQKGLVAEVATALDIFGVDVFVAHQSIAEGTSSWRAEVFEALRSSDAGIAFLHDEFAASQWCDQEVGWLLGREVPVIALRFSFAPYGPLGETQAVDAQAISPEAIAAKILAILDSVGGDLTQALTNSLLDALTKSRSFATTDSLWERLSTRNDLNASQARLVLDALQLNTQVSGASVGGWRGRPYAETLIDFLRKQPSWGEIREWAEDV